MLSRKYRSLVCNVMSAFLVCFSSCSMNDPEQSPETKNPAPEVKNITGIEVFLPEAPGSELVRQHCLTCHSLRYIEMQPDFSEKTWHKIVDKMIKNFGAPISDTTAKEIVDYLVTVKGKK